MFDRCAGQPATVGQHAYRKLARIDIIGAEQLPNAVRIDLDPVVGHTVAAEKITKVVSE